MKNAHDDQLALSAAVEGAMRPRPNLAICRWQTEGITTDAWKSGGKLYLPPKIFDVALGLDFAMLNFGVLGYRLEVRLGARPEDYFKHSGIVRR